MGIDLAGTPDHFKRCLPQQERKVLGKHAMTKEEAIESYEHQTEKALQDAVEAWIESQPDCYCRRQRMDKKTTTRRGTPDFWCSIVGQALEIECKRPGGKTSDAQDREIAHIRARKGRVIVVTTLKEVQVAVRKIQHAAFLQQ
jgi:hypothetical protein